MASNEAHVPGKFCTKCGAPTGSGQFCGHCGAALTAESTPPVSRMSGQVPGFRSGKGWKKAVAVLGYIVIALFIIEGMASRNAVEAVLGLEGVLAVLILADSWGVRSRLPLFNSPNRLASATGWIVLLLIPLILLGVTSPKTQSAGTASEGGARPAAAATVPVPTSEVAVAATKSTTDPTAGRSWTMPDVSDNKAVVGFGVLDYSIVKVSGAERCNTPDITQASLAPDEDLIVLTLSYKSAIGKNTIVPEKDFYIDGDRKISAVPQSNLKIGDALIGTVDADKSIKGRLVFVAKRYERFDTLYYTPGKEIKKLDITDPNPPPPPTDEMVLGPLNSAWGRGDWTEAVRLLDMARRYGISGVDWKDKLYVAHFNAGEEPLKQGHAADAAAHFKAAQDIDPSRGEAAAAIIALTPTALPPKPPDYKLALLSAACTWDVGFVICDGAVKNVTSGSISNVEAVITLYDGNGTAQESDEALIAFNPVLAGQTSTWQTIVTSNPAPTKFRVHFKDQFGGSILTRDDRPK